MKLSTFCSCFLLSALTLTSSLADASQVRKRSGQWEATIIYKNQASDEVKGPRNAEVDFDSDNGWGFSIGYNFDDNINLSYEFAHNRPRFSTDYIDNDGQSGTINHKADFFTNNFNLTYHFFTGQFTPYMTTGVGWATVDSNISNGKSYCYPDYYWGWYCYRDSYRETNWTFNLTAGFRADLTQNMFLKGSYGKQWIDFSQASSDPEFDIIKVELGFRLF